jgi:hypothetical protein
MTAYLIEAQQRHSHIRSLLPAVVNVLSITIKESLQLVIGGRLVEIIPLLRIVNSQPVSVSIVFWLKDRLNYHLFLWEISSYALSVPGVCRQVE